MGDIEKLRKLTESLLSSVLISSTTGVPLYKLAEDYRELALQEIPVERLGFTSLEKYLRSIPHCARIEQSAHGVLVKGVPDEKNQHIAKLVSGQKKGKKRPARKRQPFLPHRPSGRGRFSRTSGLAVARKSAVASMPPRGNERLPRLNFSGIAATSIPPRGNERPPRFNFSRIAASLPTRTDQRLPPLFIPPRMMQQKRQLANGSMRLNGDSRQERQQSRRNQSFEDGKGIVFTVKNDLVGQPVSDCEDIEGLKSNIIKLLKKYPNGLWQKVFVSYFEKEFGKSPANLLQIVRNQMSDQVEVNESTANKALITLKPEPVVTRKPLVQEELNNTVDREPQDIRVVIKKESSDDMTNVAYMASAEPEEKVTIAEQEIPGIGESFDGFVCYIQTTDRFFVHRADSEILQLSQKIHDYYQANSKKDIVNKPKIGMMCCAFYIDQWCRARLINVKPTDDNATSNLSKDKTSNKDSLLYSCHIFYIDYGNMEIVRSDMIRHLKSEFCTLPAQAIQCKLHNITEQPEWSSEAVNHFRSLTDSVELKIKVVDAREQILEVEVYTAEGKNLGEDLAAQGFAIGSGRKREDSSTALSNIPTNGEQSSEAENEEEEEEEAILSPKSGMLKRLTSLSIDNDEEEIEVPKVKLPKDQYIDILVSVVNSLTEISAILLGHDYKDRLTILEAGMQTYYDNEQKDEQTSVAKNGLYAAYDEEAWYRVTVTDIKEDEAEIYFVDRGDCGKVQTSELRKLPVQFKKLPMQAIDLTLVNLPDSDNADHVQALSDLILGKECIALVVEGDSDYPLVELYDISSDEDVSINEKIAVQLDLQVDDEQVLPGVLEQCEASISHISDSGTFSVVVPGPGLTKLTDLSKELSNFHSKAAKASDLVNNPEQGKIVCIKSKEDGCMHRVQITSVMSSEKKVEVDFIDRGNHEKVPNITLREIPDSLKELKSLPPQTVKCTLADCPEIAKDLWKDGLAKRLVSELKTQTIVIKVVKEQTDNDVAVVEMFKADPVDTSIFTSIADDITRTCSAMRKTTSPVFNSPEPAQSESSDRTMPSLSAPSTQVTSSTSSELDTDSNKSVQQDSTKPTFDSQLSVSSSVSDFRVLKTGLMIRNVAFPPVEIKDSWCTVHVTLFVNPTTFYFQLHEYVPSLIRLMEDMYQFYKDSEAVFEDCQVGDVCAVFVPDDDAWYRGVVRSLLDVDEEDKVAIFLGDYGGVIFVPTNEIRRLDEQFLSLPLQAIKGSLADVPDPPQGKWPSKTCKEFSDLVTYSIFYAQLQLSDATYPVSYSITSTERFDVRLYDTSGGTDILLNENISSAISL